ncbi:thyroid hormone receptor-associated protein 3 isoform X2 [Amia ocellicauda]|uniref:thyroid hormone receptor-associated protein 3 isoform X2 n=1 Tax=Amia ocellicauda TaxID=2972642 RepID=UPI003464BB60
MKKRTGSRSRSRSRTHSPPHRERNYPREYQNNREFRGYNRGFRRPYYYRGRGRGYYPRGRYQRGGGYGNYRPNWQNYRQQPQQHHPHSPRRGRSRSRSPKRRSGSPRSRSRSRYTDHSSSGRSRRSRGSSSSDSRSSSTHSRSGSTKRNAAKELKEGGGPVSAPKEAQKAGSRDEEAMAAAGNDNAPERPSSSWQGLIDYDTSPKRASPVVRSAIIVSQGSAAAHPSPSLQSIAVKRPSPAVKGSPSPSGSSSAIQSKSLIGAPWQNTGTTPSNKSPPQQSPTAVFSGFGFFSKEDLRAGEKSSSVSSAFKKFLEEHKSKNQVPEWENGRDKEQKAAEGEREKGNSKTGAFERGVPYGNLKPDYYGKSEKEKYKYGDEFEMSSAAEFFKGSQFGASEAAEEPEKKHKGRNQKEREMEDEPKHKSKITVTTNRDMFDERFSKWEDLAYFPSGKEKLRKEEDAVEDDMDDMEEELYRSRKQERAAAAAAAKKAEASGIRDFSPDKMPKASRKKEKPGQSPSSPPRRSSENRDRELFNVRRDDSPPKPPPVFPGKRGAEVNVRMDSFREDFASSSGILANERRFSKDLVHPSKKDQEFRSIFQHIQATQLRRSPSELFAQHIVTIVHHIKAQHFESSGMTLNERFAMYQRRAAEKEMMQPRKSPEIHRRIDVSPSAFRKRSHLFEEMKSSRESSAKDDVKKMKGDSMDLRLDIERRKKYSSKEREHKRDAIRDSGESRGSSVSRERSTEKSSKHHKKTKKRKKTRERSRSSSASSSSSRSYKGGDYPEETEPKEEGFNKARLGSRDYGGPMERGRARGGFQFRIRGRGWNRGNYPGNNSNGNPPNPINPIRSKDEEWDPEYTPKSKKYYLHDDREGEGEKKWIDNRGRGRGTFQRGRGRFMFRKTSNSPKWTHDKFQGSGEEGELPDEDSDAENKDESKVGGTAATEQ